MGTLQAENPSLWVTTTGTATQFASLADHDGAEFDVVVVGGGITGLSTALTLVERGARVALLEAGRICSGATGYTTAKVSSQHGLRYAGLVRNRGREVAAAYAAANEAAIEQIAGWVQAYDIDCEFERRDALTYTVEPGRVADVEAETTAAAELALPASFVTDTELPFDVAGAVRFTNQAQFHPRKYCLALTDAIVKQGGRIFEHSRAVGVSSDEQVTVNTEHGPIRAANVVLATHLPFLDRGGYFARAHAKRSYAVAVNAEGMTAPRGMYLSADEPTRSLRTARGDAVLIVGGEGHKTGRESDTRRCYDALQSWAANVFDRTDVVARWSAQDYTPVDGTPFAGPQLPGSRVYVATGFDKWGMTNGTAAAGLIADLIDGRESPWRVAYDTARVWPTLTARSTFIENVETVGGHLFGDRLRTLRPPSSDSLQPGQGGIVMVEGRKVAAYRHDDGKLTAVSPVCGHQGCLVAFNTAERTWDCPCHGSRYTVEGKVIEGPSVRDLGDRARGEDSAAPN